MSKEELEKVQAVIAEGVAREGLQDVIAPPEQAAASGPAEFSYPYDGGGPLHDEKLYYPEDEAGYRLSQPASDVAIDRMIADAQVAGVSLLEGPDGLLNQITRKVIERALGAELDDHLGYARGDPAGNGSGNSRNGSTGKTVTTTAGPVRLAVPRDRNSTFEPVIVPKRARRLGQVDDMILSLYARGMTTRDIQAHLVTGVDVDGFKHVLGIWLAASEGAKFWASVLAELRNRGIKDVLFVCCDGLAGITDAVEAAWPKAIVQTCVIHLIRASMRYVAYDQRKKAAAAMRPIYTAINEAAAKAALEGLRREFGKKNPGLVADWERAWPQFVPFLEFDVAIRKVIYTTNAIESINFQLRKIIKNRGHFPDDDAAIKLLYLGIRNLTGRHIDGDGLVLARGERGTGTYGWKAALNALAVRFGDRVPV